MSLIKYLNRISAMHNLIKHSSTGCSDEFARKMGLSRRQVLENLRELKELGAPIKFSNVRNSYYYEYDWTPLVERLFDNQLINTKGRGVWSEGSMQVASFLSISYQADFGIAFEPSPY